MGGPYGGARGKRTNVINNPTVLVLGAGASQPYGFPVGSDLFQLVVSNLAQDQHIRILESLGHTRDHITSFRDSLTYSGHSSVDAFLEHRLDFVEVGKAAIAQALIPFEQAQPLFQLRTGNLYKYLWGLMNAPLTQFRGNKIAFVTYNYDRSLEVFLRTSIHKTYDINVQEADAVLAKIPIIHVHGQLGSIADEDGESGRRYLHRVDRDCVQIAADGIRIIHEAAEKDEEYIKIGELAPRYSRIVFLGFGYGSTNVNRLGKVGLFRQKEVLGSTFKMGEAEVRDTVTLLRHYADVVKIDKHPSLSALEYLRNLVSWRQ